MASYNICPVGEFSTMTDYYNYALDYGKVSVQFTGSVNAVRTFSAPVSTMSGAIVMSLSGQLFSSIVENVLPYYVAGYLVISQPDAINSFIYNQTGDFARTDGPLNSDETITIGNDTYRAVSLQLASQTSMPTVIEETGVFSGLNVLNSVSDILAAIADAGISPIPDKYPITYHYTNSTVSGPAEAAIGDTVTVSAFPDTDYGITDPTTQISVTNNDAPVNFTWDAATNTITFTMPDPT